MKSESVPGMEGMKVGIPRWPAPVDVFCTKSATGITKPRLLMYAVGIACLLACSKKPAPTPPGPAPEKDYGSVETQLADGSRGRDLSAMGFKKGITFAPVYFDLNSITPKSRETLHTLIDQAPKYKACVIEGHTCPLGETVYNEALAYHRAQAVLTYLRTAGVRTGFQVISYGEERPVAFTPDAYHLNRRVLVACQ
jgi:outer membrane protein OmpA-like peptidoglycan-associated protein